MGRATRGLALGGAAVVLAAAAGLRPVAFLELANPVRGRAARFALARGEVFSVTSWHSIHDRPFTEEFAVDEEGRIALRALASPSAAVREYFGLAGPGERQPVERLMPEVVYRVAMGTPQRLRAGGAERSFLEVGDPGDRLILRARRGPVAARWLSGLAGALVRADRP